MVTRIRSWLGNTNQYCFSLYVIAAAFITYFSMYAFRKPFAAAEFEGLTIWGIDYKVIAIVSQICGYTLSKFLGIRVVAELKAAYRIYSILILMAIAWVALLLFALTPRPYNIICLFINGLPLGMIWGIVFSFLEGRLFTEFLGAGMCTSFIVSSGVVKAAGRTLIVSHQVSDFWMPFFTGLLFVPTLLLGVFMLSTIPAPSEQDEAHRTKRVPMDHGARKRFFSSFALGIFLTVSIYVFLTIFRDIRDNFAVEIWKDLGYGSRPDVLATAEIPIAIAVLIIVGLMIYIKNNRVAFYSNLGIIVSAGVLLLLTTLLHVHSDIHPVLWMILNGFSMYLAYIAYHTFLFERWIALFRHESNIGYLMYVADAFGYLGSIVVMFAKNMFAKDPSSDSQTWLPIFVIISYITALLTMGLGLACVWYFRSKERQLLVAEGANT